MVVAGAAAQGKAGLRCVDTADELSVAVPGNGCVGGQTIVLKSARGPGGIDLGKGRGRAAYIKQQVASGRDINRGARCPSLGASHDNVAGHKQDGITAACDANCIAAIESQVSVDYEIA